VHGLSGGTATIDYDNAKGLFAGSDDVVYRDYSDDGRDVVNGTYSMRDAGLLTGPVTVDTDLTMTGADTGSVHDHLVFSGLSHLPNVTVTGTASASYDGVTLSGIPAAPQACPDALPRPPRLHLAAHEDGSGRSAHVTVHVTASVDGAGSNEAGVDTRPVTDADVSMGAVTARTDATGTATLPVATHHSGPLTIGVTAGDTLAPTTTVLGPDGAGA
jgi:hypothetical protein